MLDHLSGGRMQIGLGRARCGSSTRCTASSAPACRNATRKGATHCSRRSPRIPRLPQRTFRVPPCRDDDAAAAATASADLVRNRQPRLDRLGRRPRRQRDLADAARCRRALPQALSRGMGEARQTCGPGPGARTAAPHRRRGHGRRSRASRAPRLREMAGVVHGPVAAQPGGVPARAPASARLGRIRRQGLAVAGTPQTVREFLADQTRAAGANFVLGQMVFGAMHEDEARHSLELFSQEVIPALAAR